MSIDASVIALVVKHPECLTELQRAGIKADHFSDDDRKVWAFLRRMKRQFGEVPSLDTICDRFPDLELPRTKRKELPMLVHSLKLRKTKNDFIDLLGETIRDVGSEEDISDAISSLQGRINRLTTANGDNPLVDLFAEETKERIIADIQKRRSGIITGIPTGLKKFDAFAGGLHKQQMTVIMARSGVGKSWLDLLFVASAVMNGRKVILYPLEMTVEDTAFRLYSIFSQKLFSRTPGKVLKNFDLSQGAISKKKVRQFLNILEDRYPGQLYLADVGSLSDAYTIERIEAEAELYEPDMIWVDYITLLANPKERGEDDWVSVKALSAGIKGIATRQHVVGGCSAQVNRLALKTKAFLPRLEHISFGDSIGQDADKVFALNRKELNLFYALVKNRQGPEIGRTRVKFAVNEGLIAETEETSND